MKELSEKIGTGNPDGGRNFLFYFAIIASSNYMYMYRTTRSRTVTYLSGIGHGVSGGRRQEARGLAGISEGTEALLKRKRIT